MLFRYLYTRAVSECPRTTYHIPFLYLAELEALKDRPNEGLLHEESRPNEGPLHEEGSPNEGPLREEGRPNEGPLREEGRPLLLFSSPTLHSWRGPVERPQNWRRPPPVSPLAKGERRRRRQEPQRAAAAVRGRRRRKRRRFCHLPETPGLNMALQRFKHFNEDKEKDD